MEWEAKLPGFPYIEPIWFNEMLPAPFEHDHPYKTEDVELRLHEAAAHWQAGEKAGWAALQLAPAELKESLERLLLDTGRARRRARAMAFHMRETNLARVMRFSKAGPAAIERARKDMLATLLADRENFCEELGSSLQGSRWPEMDEAIIALQADPDRFLASYLKWQKSA